MVTITKPTWCRPELCPICEQGSALEFRTCGGCGRLVLICVEEGTVFEDPRRLDEPSSADPNADVCPGCRKVVFNDFLGATWEEIQAAGFVYGEYR